MHLSQQKSESYLNSPKLQPWASHRLAALVADALRAQAARGPNHPKPWNSAANFGGFGGNPPVRELMNFNGWRVCRWTETIFRRSCGFWRGILSWSLKLLKWHRIWNSGKGILQLGSQLLDGCSCGKMLASSSTACLICMWIAASSAAVQRFRPVREVPCGGRQWISFRRCFTWRSNGISFATIRS